MKIKYKIIITYNGILPRQDILFANSDTEIKDTFYNYDNDCFNYSWHDNNGKHTTSIPLRKIFSVDVAELP